MSEWRKGDNSRLLMLQHTMIGMNEFLFLCCTLTRQYTYNLSGCLSVQVLDGMS